MSVSDLKYNVDYFTFVNNHFKYNVSASLYPSTLTGTQSGCWRRLLTHTRRPHQECRARTSPGLTAHLAQACQSPRAATASSLSGAASPRTHPPHAVDVVTLCSFAYCFLVIYGRFYVVQHIISNTTTQRFEFFNFSRYQFNIVRLREWKLFYFNFECLIFEVISTLQMSIQQQFLFFII